MTEPLCKERLFSWMLLNFSPTFWKLYSFRKTTCRNAQLNKSCGQMTKNMKIMTCACALSVATCPKVSVIYSSAIFTAFNQEMVEKPKPWDYFRDVWVFFVFFVVAGAALKQSESDTQAGNSLSCYLFSLMRTSSNWNIPPIQSLPKCNQGKKMT